MVSFGGVPANVAELVPQFRPITTPPILIGPYISTDYPAGIPAYWTEGTLAGQNDQTQLPVGTARYFPHDRFRKGKMRRPPRQLDPKRGVKSRRERFLYGYEPKTYQLYVQRHMKENPGATLGEAATAYKQQKERTSTDYLVNQKRGLFSFPQTRQEGRIAATLSSFDSSSIGSARSIKRQPPKGRKSVKPSADARARGVERGLVNAAKREALKRFETQQRRRQGIAASPPDDNPDEHDSNVGVPDPSRASLS
jgi:hypothetical protein